MVQKSGKRPSEALLELQRSTIHCEHHYWRWSIAGINISGPSQCITVPPDSNDIDSSTTIAWFTPRHAKKEVPTTLCRLQVTPSGQTLFDDIVMSILAIERRILTPYNFTAESLFNYSSLEL